MSLIQALPLTETKLRILFELYSEGEDYLRNIERKTAINPSLLHRILNSLTKARIISKTKQGREYYYTLTTEGKNAFQDTLEQYHLDRITKKYEEIEVLLKLLHQTKNWFNSSKIYLFGSYASGVPAKESDIDILFVSSEKDKILKWCGEASVILGRNLSPLIYTSPDFRNELKQREPLLTSIITKIKNRVILK